MAAMKYSVDDKVTLQGKVVEAIQSEDGTFYKVKIVANNKATTIYLEEDEIVGPVSNQTNNDPEPEPDPSGEPTSDPDPNNP